MLPCAILLRGLKKKMSDSRGALRISEETYQKLKKENTRSGVPVTKIIDRAVALYLEGVKPEAGVAVPPSLAIEVSWLIEYFSEQQSPEGEALKKMIKMFARRQGERLSVNAS